MKPMQLETRQVGPWQMNGYALLDPNSNRSVLFDPGGDPDILVKMLGDTRCEAILLTHTHVDHVMALDEMKQRLGVPVLLHPGAHDNGERVRGDAYLRDGDTFTLGDHQLRIEHAPGHIGNQICFHIENDPRIIVGDTIFAGGPGRTWSTAGFQTTLNTLREVVLNWPDEAVCHPGHGPIFTLGAIRPKIETFLTRDHGDFFGNAEW